MPRLPTRPLILVLALALTVGLASCGEEDAQLLPGNTAREITANLDTVQALADEGDCFGAESAAQQVSEQIETLDVDRELLQALEKGATRLSEVIEGCEEDTAESIAPATIPAEGEEEGEAGGEPRRDGRPSEKRAKPAKPEAQPQTPTTPTQPQRPEGGNEGEGGEEPGGEEEGGGGEPSGGVSPANPAGGGE